MLNAVQVDNSFNKALEELPIKISQGKVTIKNVDIVAKTQQG